MKVRYRRITRNFLQLVVQQPYCFSVLGIKYQGNDIDGFVGFYYASPTKDGIRWGLRNPWVGSTAVHPNQVTTVLAVDENGLAAGWVKNYGGPPGTGLVQLWIPECVPRLCHAQKCSGVWIELSFPTPG